MKRLFKGIAAAGISLTMLAGNTLHMFAVETPTTQKTTAGIQLATSRAKDWNGYNQNHDVVVTIPEDFTGDVIHVYPLEDIPDITAQPGDKMNINVKIVNNSGKNYNYVDQSLNVSYPEQDLSEPRETVYRAYNVALEALGVENKSASLTDDAIATKLRAKGYGTDAETNADVCVKYLDDYYLAYYNSSFKAPGDSEATDLSQVSEAYRRAIFNDSTYKDLNDDWVPMPTQFRPDNTTKERESNVEVNKLSYDHAYKELLQLNIYPLFDYTDTTSEAYSDLNTTLNTDVFAQDGFNLKKWIQGAAGNAYQNHVFYSDMSFTLALDGVKPEEKTSEPDLVKKITDGDKIIIDEGENAGDHATIDASGRVDFTLTSHVGEDLAEVIKPIDAVDPGMEGPNAPVDQFDTTGNYTFTFVDHLDEELILDETSIKVSVNGKTVTLPETAITTSTVPDGEEHAGRTQIRVSFDLVDLFEDEFFAYEEIGTAPIVMTYSAHVKDPDEVTPGKMYNTAWVEYRDKETMPDEVDVDTFGVKVFKYDQTTNKGLQGAKFELSYKDEQGNKVVVATATSGSDGYVVFKGLKEGSYQIEETEAPAGYVKSDKPLTILVNAENDDGEYYVKTEFANVPEVHTGGSGTMLFTLGGGALLVIGAATYLISKKRQEN